MKLAVIKETKTNESRVAITPDLVKEYITKLGVEVHIQKSAGQSAGFSDEAYKEAGAKIDPNANTALSAADIVLTVQPLTVANISQIKKGATVVGLLATSEVSLIKKYSDNKISAFAMEYLPRITRAQSMDVLSSQSNIAGYKAVIDAFAEFGKVVPMMTTAAGTIKPAKVLILGAGVAGLQAIATAKRMGAVVSAFDVRSVVKEQVMSLGASFVEVAADAADGENKAGYAKEMSEDYKKRQAERIGEAAAASDIIVCTALIPGQIAPQLLSEKMVKDMKPGSVIIDLAAVAGGNCALTEKNKIVDKFGVKIIGYENIPARVPFDSSRLYARNLFNFMQLIVSPKLGKIKLDFADQIIQSCTLTHDGKVVHPNYNKGKIEDAGAKDSTSKPQTKSKATVKSKAKSNETKVKNT